MSEKGGFSVIFQNPWLHDLFIKSEFANVCKLGRHGGGQWRTGENSMSPRKQFKKSLLLPV